jgi:AbrB family looped-hinge helix DNA binding protein
MAIRATAKLSPRGNSQAVTIPKDILEATGLRPGDELSLLARDDGVIEIRQAAPAEADLEAGFEWSLGRYGQTYADLAK